MHVYCAHCGAPLTGPACSRCGAPAAGMPPVAAATETTTPIATAPGRHRARTHRRILAAALAVVLLAGGVAIGVGYVYLRAHPSAAPAGSSLGPAVPAARQQAAGVVPQHAGNLTANWAALPHPALGCPTSIAPEAIDTRYADLNGDGTPDAVVTVDCAVQTGHSPTIVEIYDGGSTGTPNRLGTLLTGADNLSIATLQMSGQTIVLTENGWSPNAPNSTPDLHYTEAFSWNGNGFTSGGRTMTSMDNSGNSGSSNGPATITVPSEPTLSTGNAQARADRCVSSLTTILSNVAAGQISESSGESQIPHQAARDLLEQALYSVQNSGESVDQAAYEEFHAYCQNKYGLPA